MTGTTKVILGLATRAMAAPRPISARAAARAASSPWAEMSPNARTRNPGVRLGEDTSEESSFAHPAKTSTTPTATPAALRDIRTRPRPGSCDPHSRWPWGGPYPPRVKQTQWPVPEPPAPPGGGVHMNSQKAGELQP